MDNLLAAPETVKSRRIPEGVVSVSEVLLWLQDDPFFSVKEASNFSRLRPRQLHHDIKAGKLRAFRIGCKTLIRRSDLIAYIEQHEISVEKTRTNKTALNEMLDRCIQRAKAKVEHKEGR